MEVSRKYCPVEDISYVESSLNPSDISTRATSKLEDIGPNSFHQRGPNFLTSCHEMWPVTRDFDKQVLPENELKTVDAKVSMLKSNPYKK